MTSESRRWGWGLALLAVGVPPAFAAARVPAAGRYCLHEALSGNTGRGSIPLGEFAMVVRVERRSGAYHLSFWNKMPDTPYVLTAEGRALAGRDGALRMAFEDGWGNHGSARFGATGVMVLALRKESDDPFSRDIGRNYGTYRLSRKACAHPIFRFQPVR